MTAEIKFVDIARSFVFEEQYLTVEFQGKIFTLKVDDIEDEMIKDLVSEVCTSFTNVNGDWDDELEFKSFKDIKEMLLESFYDHEDEIVNYIKANLMQEELEFPALHLSECTGEDFKNHEIKEFVETEFGYRWVVVKNNKKTVWVGDGMTAEPQ